jgi:hypothetical protein
MGLALTSGPFRPVALLEQQGIVARGLVCSRRMPLRDIVEIEGGCDGLEFVLVDRRREITGVGARCSTSPSDGVAEAGPDSNADSIRHARERVLADVPVSDALVGGLVERGSLLAARARARTIRCLRDLRLCWAPRAGLRV